MFQVQKGPILTLPSLMKGGVEAKLAEKVEGLMS